MAISRESQRFLTPPYNTPSMHAAWVYVVGPFSSAFPAPAFVVMCTCLRSHIGRDPTLTRVLPCHSHRSRNSLNDKESRRERTMKLAIVLVAIFAVAAYAEPEAEVSAPSVTAGSATQQALHALQDGVKEHNKYYEKGTIAMQGRIASGQEDRRRGQRSSIQRAHCVEGKAS